VIGLMYLSLAQAQMPAITIQRAEPRPLSKPRYEVECELRDLNFGKSYRIALTQYGGVYGTTARGLPARSMTYVRFSHDDLGIFGEEELNLTGSQVTDWYSDGPIELVAKGGGGAITINKSTKRQAWLQSPTQIAVTVKGGRRVRSNGPARTWEEFTLIGCCDVAWQSQEAEPSRRNRVKS